MTSRALRVVLLVALAVFYVSAATEHARLVNTSKARGDQSGYLWDAQNMYGNWHGSTAPMLIGERNRMPLYAAFLARVLESRRSPTTTSSSGRSAGTSICRSGCWRCSRRCSRTICLPLPSTNLTLVVAFGYFIFKAGYTQSELLFYFLFFITFLLFWEILARPAGLSATVVRAVAAGGDGGARPPDESRAAAAVRDFSRAVRARRAAPAADRTRGRRGAS